MIRGINLSIDGSEISDYNLSSGNSIVTDRILSKENEGFSAIIVELSSGNIDIEFECSLDGENFYTPVDTNLNDLGGIVEGLTSSKYIIFEPQPSKYMRFKITANSDSIIKSMKYLQVEES